MLRRIDVISKKKTRLIKAFIRLIYEYGLHPVPTSSQCLAEAETLLNHAVSRTTGTNAKKLVKRTRAAMGLESVVTRIWRTRVAFDKDYSEVNSARIH